MSPGTMKTIVVTAAIAALMGCSGGPTDEPAGHRVGLIDSAPLPTLLERDWLGAAEGCEGRLDGSEEFGITQSDALVVARQGVDGGGSGDVVCIDTLEAVSLELEALGADYAADELYSGFYAAIHLSQVQDWATPTSESQAEGDPNPQPNGTTSPPLGDPNPQPNMPGSDLEPSIGDPIPSMPDPGDPAVDPAPDADSNTPEAPLVVIEDTALPGI